MSHIHVMNVYYISWYGIADLNIILKKVSQLDALVNLNCKWRTFIAGTLDFISLLPQLPLSSYGQITLCVYVSIFMPAP